MKKCVVLLAVTLVSVHTLSAQDRQFRVHKPKDIAVQFSIGASQMLGDLGGGTGIGQHHVGDVNFTATRGGAEAALIFRSIRRTKVKLGLTYANLYGSDAFTDNLDRRERNFAATTNLFEPAVMLEQQISRIHEKYTRSGGYWYLIGGLAVPLFSSKITYAMPGGSSYALPANRGLQATVAIPLGISYRYYFHRESSIGFEFVGRKTFSDYVDGTQASYSGNVMAIGDGGTLPVQQSIVASSRSNDAVKDQYMMLMISFRHGIEWSRN